MFSDKKIYRCFINENHQFVSKKMDKRLGKRAQQDARDIKMINKFSSLGKKI